MGISLNPPPPGGADTSQSHYQSHKVFLLCNYILLGAASSCIFLTLSLRLIPSLCGFFLILLQVFTIVGAVSGCTTASGAVSERWYAAHMVSIVLTAIFQGAVAMLIYFRTGDFLGKLRSYVREEDGAVILRTAGGLCIAIFCLEWIVLGLAFMLRYYSYLENGSARTRRSVKVQQDDTANWPWPFQVNDQRNKSIEG